MGKKSKKKRCKNLSSSSSEEDEKVRKHSARKASHCEQNLSFTYVHFCRLSGMLLVLQLIRDGCHGNHWPEKTITTDIEGVASTIYNLYHIVTCLICFFFILH